MKRIDGVKKLTDNRFLNLYDLSVRHRTGKESSYYVASRAKKVEELEALSHENHADGVIIYGVYGEKRDKVVLIRQYRYPLGDYVYELPAGLVERNEDILEAGVREFYEETGMTLEPVHADPMYMQPRYTSAGMTDESCGTVYGYATGTPDVSHEEESEDIQIVLADRMEASRILKEEKVALMCAYMLMYFISSDKDPLSFVPEEK